MDQLTGYTDVHAHILPGVDDGSRSMEQTIQMLKLALQQKITTMIATPHYLPGEKNASVDQLYTVRDEVQAQATKLHKDYKILLGNELYYSDALLEDLKSKRALTLADSRYVLVEFSVRVSYGTIYRAMGELLQAGYAPILAHVERYQCLNKREDLISEIKKLGCYLQMNSSSLTGGMFHSGASWNRKLVRIGLIHLIGSDCHDDKVRIPSMATAADMLHKKCGDTITNQIFLKNPHHILENTYI